MILRGTFKMTPTEINVTKNDYGIGSGVGSIDIDRCRRFYGTATVTERNTILYTPENFYHWIRHLDLTAFATLQGIVVCSQSFRHQS
jgi:hypothetical protein